MYLCVSSTLVSPVQASAHKPRPPISDQCAAAMANERTFIMVKPDGVQRGLIADIIKRFEQKGFKLVAMKFLKVGQMRLASPCVTWPAAF